jgi:UDP-N-acetylglucosamine 4,6-dehydratase
MELKKEGVKEFPITDERMTRFWITLEQGVDLVIKALELSVGGEVFIPKIPSMKIIDLAKTIQPDCRMKIVGIRPGEKIHETLVSEEEARNVKILNGFFVIIPQFSETKEAHKKYDSLPVPAEGFVYRSDKNEEWLKGKELNRVISNLHLE